MSEPRVVLDYGSMGEKKFKELKARTVKRYKVSREDRERQLSNTTSVNCKTAYKYNIPCARCCICVSHGSENYLFIHQDPLLFYVTLGQTKAEWKKERRKKSL